MKHLRLLKNGGIICLGLFLFYFLTLIFCRRFGSEKESDYLHHSSVPTMFFQDHLPPLPRPTLQESCRRFIESLSPLVSEQEKETAKRLVSEFSAGVGKELQDKLDSLPPTFAQGHVINIVCACLC